MAWHPVQAYLNVRHTPIQELAEITPGGQDSTIKANRKTCAITLNGIKALDGLLKDVHTEVSVRYRNLRTRPIQHQFGGRTPVRDPYEIESQIVLEVSWPLASTSTI